MAADTLLADQVIQCSSEPENTPAAAISARPLNLDASLSE